MANHRRNTALIVSGILWAQLAVNAGDNTATLKGKADLQDKVNAEEERLLLVDLPVKITIEDSNHRTHAHGPKTDEEGRFTTAVEQGRVDILIIGNHIVRRGDRNFSVSLRGEYHSLEELSPPRTYSRSVPTKATSIAKSANAPVSAAAGLRILLTRYEIPVAASRVLPALARADPNAYTISGGQSGRPTPPDREDETVTGKLTDALSGAVVPAARLRLQSVETGDEVSGGRSELGAQFVLRMPLGRSVFVLASAPGYVTRILVFSTEGERPALYDEDSTPLANPSTIALNRAEEREAPAAEEGVDLSESSRHITYGARLIELLPMQAFRNVDRLIELAPGVAPAPETWGPEGPSLSPGLGSPGPLSINGLRSRESSFNFDGSDYNDEEAGTRRQGFTTPYPLSVESFSNLHVTTAAGDARFGRSLAGQIDALSKTGGPKFHGEVYGFMAPHALHSRNFFDQRTDGYPVDMRRMVKVTGDGTLSGTGVMFLLDPDYRGPVMTRDGVGYQPNPLAAEPGQSQYQYGFAMGGPVGRKQTYLFVSLEREVQNGQTQAHYSVPTMRQRGIAHNGDVGQTETPFFGPATDTYPTTLQGDGVFSLFPLPNNPIGPYGANTYTTASPTDARGYLYSVKADQELRWIKGREHNWTVRWNQTKDAKDLVSVGGAIDSAIQPVIRGSNIASFFTTRVTPRFFNTFRFSAGYTSVHFDAEPQPNLIASDAVTRGPDVPYLLNAPLLLNTTLPGTAPQYRTAASSPSLLAGEGLMGPPNHAEAVTGPVGQVSIGGYSPVGIDVYHYPQRRNDSTVQYADTASISAGRHLVYAGFDTRSTHLDTYVDRNARPLIEFHGVDDQESSILDSVSLAALGAPTGLYQTVAVQGESPIVLEQRQLDFFAHDYFTVANNLTLNGGIRLELSRVPSSSQRLAQGFDPATIGDEVRQAKLDCGKSSRPPDCIEIANQLQAVIPQELKQVVNAGLQGKTARAGLAWDPFGDRRTAIRAGWGLYSGVFPFALINETRSAFDQFLSMNLAVAPIQPTLKSAVPLTGLNVLAPGHPGPASLLATNLATLVPVEVRNLKNSYSMQFAVAVERQLPASITVEAAYVGTLGRRLVQATTPQGGAGLPSLGIARPLFLRGPFPSYATLGSLGTAVAPTVYDDSGSSSYHSMQIEARRRFRNGVEFRISGTYSRAMDYGSDFFDTKGSFALPQSGSVTAERGYASFDTRFRTTGYLIWTLPFAAKNHYLGGWQLLALNTAQTGQPYTVNSANDVNEDGNTTDRLDSLAFLAFHPDRSDRRVQVAATTPRTNAMLSSLGADGRVGRNSFRSVGMWNLDLAAVKDIALPKAGAFTVRLEAFNAMNHANFGIPVRVLEAPEFGTSVSTVTPGRAFQIAVKKAF